MRRRPLASRTLLPPEATGRVELANTHSLEVRHIAGIWPAAQTPFTQCFQDAGLGLYPE